MKRTLLIVIFLLAGCPAFSQNRDSLELAALFNMDMSVIMGEQIDTLNKEVRRLNRRIDDLQEQIEELAYEETQTKYRARESTRLLQLLHRIDRKQIKRVGDTSYFFGGLGSSLGQPDDHDEKTIVYVEYRVMRYLPGYSAEKSDSVNLMYLLRDYPHVDRLVEKGKLALRQFAYNVARASGPAIMLPPSPRVSVAANTEASKKELAEKWVQYIGRLSGICECSEKIDKLNASATSIMQQRKAASLKTNGHKMTVSEELDMQIEMWRKIAYQIETKYIHK